MIDLQRIQVAGQRFVLLPEGEYERLCSRAGETVPLTDDELPPLPKPDKHGNYPAVEYARVGLTQTELARLAGSRQETISRIESGKHAASVKLIDRIDQALKQAAKSRRKRR
jgi:DNA-binding XRE family transcriptional regulator